MKEIEKYLDENAPDDEITRRLMEKALKFGLRKNLSQKQKWLSGYLKDKRIGYNHEAIASFKK